MHLPEVCCLDGVIAVKGIRNPIVAVIISMECAIFTSSRTH
jgi:hypothetical protein